MKAIKLIIGLVIVLALALLIASFVLPKQVTVEESIEIDASVPRVFSMVSDYREFNQWSPWAAKDPNMDVTYSGEGQGATMSWSSDHEEVMSGIMKTVELVPGQTIVQEVTMPGMTEFKAWYDFEPAGENTTKVTWGFETPLTTLGERFAGLFIGDMVAADYQKGLARLKEQAEAEPRIMSREVTYTAGDTDLVGYYAWPEGAQNVPGVIVVHEWWGHNDYARHRADMLAEAGYAALALDMYGDGKTAGHPDEAMAFMQQVTQNAELARTRFDAAVELLQQQEQTNPDQLGAIGYCFGGAVVLSMARTDHPALEGVVSFHGALQGLPPVDPQTDVQMLVLTGAADPFVPPEQVTAFEQEMDAANAPYKLHAYEGATHSFTNPGANAKAEEFGLPLAYDPEADRDSWARTMVFFKKLFAQ